MQEQHAFPFLREILLFLTLAGILIPLLQRFRISQVLGFLAVGALLGPFGLALFASDVPWLGYLTFANSDGIKLLGELGVIFLMFMIGLELSAARLWALRKWVFGAGVAQVCLCTALIGGAVLLLGHPVETAIILGFVLSLSSTAVVMQLMNESHTASTPLGLAGFSLLMLQDLAVVPLLILIGAMSKSTGADPTWLIAGAMLKAGIAVTLIYLLGGRLLHPLFRTFARQRQPDVFMALILLATLGIAGLSAMAGLSMALGALIAGLLLAETEFKHEIEMMIEPFKGLLMGLFFMTVGMGMDVRQIALNPFWLAAAVVGLVAVKAAVVAALFRVGGLGRGRAIEGGLMLAQGGEFAFIAIAYAVAGNLVARELGQLVVLTVGLTLFITPMLTRLGRLIGDRWEHHEDTLLAARDGVALEHVRQRIIIAGYGRVGQQLGKLLTAQNMPFVAFENNAKLVAKMRALGLPVFFGDASRTELLRRVDAGSAPAIVLTMDHPIAALHAVRGIRREFPEVPLLARSRDARHALALKQAGATTVVPETLEASLQLSASVLKTLGVDEGDIDRIVDDERDLFSATLDRDAQLGLPQTQL